MISVNAELLAAIESPNQQPRYKLLHEAGKTAMAWTDVDPLVTGKRVHTVAQAGGKVAYLWFEAATNRWETGFQEATAAVETPLGTGMIATGGLADPTGGAGTLSGPTHRVQFFETAPDTYVVQAILANATGALTLINNTGGTMAVRGTIPASSEVSSAAGYAVSNTRWTGPGTPRIFLLNTTKGRLEVVPWTADAPVATPWDYGTHWTLYHIAPYAVQDEMGRDVIYFTGAARNGKGRTLYKTTYDPLLDVWTEPEDVFIFDTSNPSNGIQHPLVSVLDNGWYAMTYVKQTGDSDAVVSSQYIGLRLAPHLGATWGPERMIASMSSLVGVSGRSTFEPLQPVPLVRDWVARKMVAWTRQGYYHATINMTWGIPPGGVDITDRFSAFTANCSNGLTAGTLNLINEKPRETAPFLREHDLIHVQYGLVTTAGVEYVPVMSAMVDTFKPSEREDTAPMECRELSARLQSAGKQDEATIWTGANHYAFVPSATNYQEFVLPTQIDRALATDTAVTLGDSFRAADSKYAASAVYSLTVTPFDECTTADAGRYRIAAPFLPATDVTVEGIFELVVQKTSIDPQPGVYCGADSDGKVYYSLEYRTKQRKVIFAVQRVTLLGAVARTETVVATIPPGGTTGVYTRVGLRITRHGDRLSCAYMTQNTPAGTPLWREHAFVYTDTADPAAYTSTPMSLSVPGYCGIVAFSEVLGLSAETTVNVYLAQWRAFGVRPPLTYAHVLRDALVLGGFDSHMEGVGFLAGDPPTLGTGASPDLADLGLTGTTPWEADGDVLRHDGEIASLLTPDAPTDAVGHIHPVGETAWVTLEGRMTTLTPNSVFDPVPLTFTGERIGVTLTSRLGSVADHLGMGVDSPPMLWFWRTTAVNAFATIATVAVPPWMLDLVSGTGYLKSAKFTLAMQDTLVGVWVNDSFAGGIDLESEVLPIPAVRPGQMQLLHAGPIGATEVEASALWFSAVPNTVAQMTVNTQDSLSQWIGNVINTAALDCAFRSSGAFRLVRPDVARATDLVVSSRVLDATVTLSAYEVLTHVRYLGKDGIYGDSYDIALFIEIGERFEVFTDESLVTVEQCRAAAKRKLIEVNRTDLEMESVIVFDPRMERLDVVQVLAGLVDETCYITDFSLQGVLKDVITISPGLRRVGVL